MKKTFDNMFAGKAETLTKQYGQKYGISNAWQFFTIVSLMIWTLLTILAQYDSPDFVSITICALGILAISVPDLTSRKQFRVLVLLILISWLYDCLQLFWLKSKEEEDKADGGVQSTVRGFGLLFVYISFLFRLVVFVCFWRASVDFTSAIKGKTGADDIGTYISAGGNRNQGFNQPAGFNNQPYNNFGGQQNFGGPGFNNGMGGN